MYKLFLMAWTVFVMPAVQPSCEWPQFHGPNRDNKSADTGLLKSWPEGGPPLLWEVSGIGQGYSSVAVARGKIYVTGEIEGNCVITALDLNGKILWQQANGKAWSGSYPGTRSTPTIAPDGLLYHESGLGNLICLEADSGQRVWQLNILERFQGRNITWGLSESPLVVDDLVICTPGGPKISIVALDRKTGRMVWTCTGAEDKPGYASPILVEYEGLRQVVTVMAKSVVGVRLSDGKLLWRYPHKVFADENILTPLFQDGLLIVSGPVRKGTTALRLLVNGQNCSVKVEWYNRTLDNKHGGLVLVNDRIYGYAETQVVQGPWVCVDFKTGETIYQGSPLKSSYMYRSGSLTYADGMLYLYSDDGKAALVQPTSSGFEVRGRLVIENPGERPTWAHPVVCGGRLYLRYRDRLAAYDVRAQTSSMRNPTSPAIADAVR